MVYMYYNYQVYTGLYVHIFAYQMYKLSLWKMFAISSMFIATFALSTGTRELFHQRSRGKWWNIPESRQICALLGQTCLPFSSTLFIGHAM